MTDKGCSAHERANLRGREMGDFIHRAGDRAAAEAKKIGIAGMGTHNDIVGLCEGHRLDHCIGIAGMGTAGDIGAGHDLQHLFIMAHHPRAEAFAEIGVEIDGQHCAYSRCDSVLNKREGA